MIVVDTNLIAYLFLSGARTREAEQALQKDGHWAAPLLWRSEFRNVLAGYARKKLLAVSDAVEIMDEAESLLSGNEYSVGSEAVLVLAASSGCSAYDCEFVALAQDLGVPLVTTDKQVLSAFPETTIALKEFTAS